MLSIADDDRNEGGHGAQTARRREAPFRERAPHPLAHRQGSNRVADHAMSDPASSAIRSISDKFGRKMSK